jgi:lipopolysaccharide export system protein LptC
VPTMSETQNIEQKAKAAAESMLDSPLFSRLGVATPFHVLENIGRYTRFVGLAKFILLLAAIGLVIMVSAIMMVNNSAKDKVRVVFSDVAQGVAERPIMLTPRFEGVDANDQPYSITATQAAQTKVNDEDYIQMQSLNADLALNNGGWVNLRAKDGVLAATRRLLHLKGDVSVYDHQGYEMHTPQAWVKLNEGQAYGNDGVQGAGPTGTLKADSFLFDQKAQTAHFSGNVVVTLYETPKEDTAEE